MRCGSAMWARFNKRAYFKTDEEKSWRWIGHILRQPQGTINRKSINQVTRTEPTGEQKMMDRNNYVDADHAREEKEGQGMAWARPKKKAAGRNSVEGFSSMSYASL